MTENFISHLEEQIRHHNDLYWKKGTPEISDAEYDRLVETLRSWDPENPLLKKVEAPAAAGEKIVHTKPMLSLDKVYTKEELRQWMAKVARSSDELFLVQPKYDGISGKLEHGVLVTRGDGHVGVNITDKLPIIQIVTEKSDGILGEIVIPNSVFDTLYSGVKTKAGTPFKNSRNAVAGIVANDGVKFYQEQGARLTFIDYDKNSHELKLNEFAEKWDGIQRAIEQLDYPMDGIVVRLADAAYAESLGYTEHHPRGAMALKFTNVSVESVVTGFTLSIGKRGTLAATAQIEPRDIGGVTVTNVKVPVIDTLDGQPGILSGGIRIGSKVRVERAGDVIPYLAEVLEVGEAAPTAITDCPVCGSKLVRDGANLFCRNPECGEQQLNQLYFSVMTVGMFGIGKEIVRAIMDITGIRDFLGFMRLDGSLLVGQEGFGKTRITAIMDEIEKARHCTPELFLTALNVPELGKKASEELLKIYGVDEIIAGLTIAQLLRANGIGEVMAKRISEGLVEKQAYIQELRKEFQLSQAAPAPEGDTICFTGKSTRPRSEMHQAAREKGLVPVDAVTSTTKYLVVADPNSTSSKVVKARKMGVTILSEEQFWAFAPVAQPANDAPAAQPASVFKRVGVINWDCSMPSETTFFGHYATQSLGPRQFRDRTPYYAIETSPDTIQYRERTVADYEIELRHAIAAGIDYFAYCWYDRKPHTDHLVNGQAANVDDKVCELVDARMKHLASPLRNQIGLCAILITPHPYSDEELEDLVKTMQEPFYEKIDGRPLVYLFISPNWKEALGRLRTCCAKAGVPDPYAVLMANSISPEDTSLVQALCSYACSTVQAHTWSEFFEVVMDRNEQRSKNGLPVIPHFSMGWNPSPRNLHPVPWVTYQEGDYPPPATTEQLLDAAKHLKVWVEANRALCSTGHVLTFAWNEFEEGAWICPTLGPTPNTPDTHYRDTFAQISRFWKR